MVSVTKGAYSRPPARPLKERGAGRLRLTTSSKLRLFSVRFRPVQAACTGSSASKIIRCTPGNNFLGSAMKKGKLEMLQSKASLHSRSGTTKKAVPLSSTALEHQSPVID